MEKTNGGNLIQIKNLVATVNLNNGDTLVTVNKANMELKRGNSYTLEVEPDGTIRQTRTFYNQQNEDIDLARDFLVKWQKQLKKKLAKEDYKLAVKSQSLRKKEIDELRSKGVRVNGVGYCNKLLAEILEEDLMEAGNRELEEQAA